jgi:hypothetical protein
MFAVVAECLCHFRLLLLPYRFAHRSPELTLPHALLCSHSTDLDHFSILLDIPTDGHS